MSIANHVSNNSSASTILQAVIAILTAQCEEAEGIDVQVGEITPYGEESSYVIISSTNSEEHDEEDEDQIRINKVLAYAGINEHDERYISFHPFRYWIEIDKRFDKEVYSEQILKEIYTKSLDHMVKYDFVTIPSALEKIGTNLFSFLDSGVIPTPFQQDF